MKKYLHSKMVCFLLVLALLMQNLAVPAFASSQDEVTTFCKECGGIVVLINNHRLLRLDGHLIRADSNARSSHVCHKLPEVSQFTDAHLLVCNERHLLREYLLIVSTCLAIDTL